MHLSKGSALPVLPWLAGGEVMTGMREAKSGPSEIAAIALRSWNDRLEAAFRAYLEWKELPVALLMDRILKAAGTRDLIAERDRYREALEEICKPEYQLHRDRVEVAREALSDGE